jgi:DNA-binding transcriptional MocR family regulator
MNQFDYQRALFASELTANERLTACVIGSHYNWKTKEESFPSNRTIARESGLSIRSVIRSKNNLVSQGYLVSQRRYDMSNTYIPCVPQSHDECQSGNLIDTLKDTLKDNLKDTNVSNETFDIVNNNSLEEVTIITDDSSALIEDPSVHYKEMTAAASRIIDEDWLSW